MSKKIKTIFIVGPTASGKTSLSIELAKRFNGEIVSADSMQLYKGIHIASAAPDESEKSGIEHHLIEFLDLSQEYSVAEYVKNARECIKEISENGKMPIIVGGTGLYINSLLDNTQYLDEETNPQLRLELEEKMQRIGAENMLKELEEFDPESAQRLHPNNRRRIIRAFEVYILTGKTITEQNAVSHNVESELEPLVIGITYDNRELLYERINQRVEIMLSNGLLEEAKSTFNSASSKGAFQAIGHKELYPFIRGDISLEEAKENLCRQTRRYAKRQLTWFRRDERINWIYPDLSESITKEATKLCKEFLKGGKTE